MLIIPESAKTFVYREFSRWIANIVNHWTKPSCKGRMFKLLLWSRR